MSCATTHHPLFVTHRLWFFGDRRNRMCPVHVSDTVRLRGVDDTERDVVVRGFESIRAPVYSQQAAYPQGAAVRLECTPTAAERRAGAMVFVDPAEEARHTFPLTWVAAPRGAATVATVTVPLAVVGNDMRLVRSRTFDALLRSYQNARATPRMGVWQTHLRQNQLSPLLATVHDYVRRRRAQLLMHPHSEKRVLDIIHPSVCPYAHGTSAVVQSEKGVTDTLGQEPASGRTDFWNRPYERSAHQMLPAEVDVDARGRCRFVSDINTVPRTETALYAQLEALLTRKVLPLMERTWGHTQAVRLWDDADAERDGTQCTPTTVAAPAKTLRNRRLQVVVKLTQTTLHSPSDRMDGAWHVEGMSHEQIVSSVVCVLHQGSRVRTRLRFKRRFTFAEADCALYTSPQDRHPLQDTVYNEGVVPLGTVTTHTGTCTAFPNSHIHCLDQWGSLATTVASTKKHARPETTSRTAKATVQDRLSRVVAVFWLVHPDQRVLSTQHVGNQGTTLAAPWTLAERKRVQNAFMQDRKFFKNSFNVRPLNLCEH